MRPPRRIRSSLSSRLRELSAIAASVAIAAACQGAASPLPDSPSPGASLVPAQSTARPTESQPSPMQSASPGRPAAHWEPASSTAVYRNDARLIRLSSGGVVVIGNGEASDGLSVPTTAEIWEPSTSVWSEIEDLNKPRFAFAAVPLSDDRVLVAGGLNDATPPQSYSSAYIYDARAPREGWSKTGLMLVARTAPSAAVLSDGRVLVAGGFFYVQPDFGAAPDAYLATYHRGWSGMSGQSVPRLFDVDLPPAGAAMATAELFDPATGTWTATGAMTYARSGAPAVTLADGRVLIVGSAEGSGSREGLGVEVDGHAFLTAEIYDPVTGRFTLAGRMPEIDRAALEAQGQPGANPMPEDNGQPLGPGTLVALQDGGAVLIGQTRWWKHVADMTRSFRFDVRTGAWSEIGATWVEVGEPGLVPLTTPGVRNLAGALAAAIPDGRVLVAGGTSSNGESGSGASTVAELYDPATDTWAAAPAMPDGRSWGDAVTLADGSVLLVGGLDNRGIEGATRLTTATRFVP